MSTDNFKYKKKVLVTGGAGFIGSNFVQILLQEPDVLVVNLDKLTYAGNLDNLKPLAANDRHIFVRGDICDKNLLDQLFTTYSFDKVVHFAAESHVDRSISSPEDFLTTNVIGTFRLLECTKNYYQSLGAQLDKKHRFRFLHVSTDEVYGSLSPDSPGFTEENKYAPNSPYSASKAASDHFVRAYHHTYGLPVITTNCSNNYGPYQFPEKLLPLCILNALALKPLPIYGDGQQVRDWLYVEDHCKGILQVLAKGRVGETYNIGGFNEQVNLEVVKKLCLILDELRPRDEEGKSYQELITFVTDRPGHDRRYAIDATKIEKELGWRPEESFDSGLRKTVQWYLENPAWVASVQSGAYRDLK